MKCFFGLPRFWMSGLPFFWLSCLFYIPISAVSGNSTMIQSILMNATLCSFNQTVSGQFNYVVESYLLAPLVTTTVYAVAQATACFLDLLFIGGVFTAAAVTHQWALAVAFGLPTLLALCCCLRKWILHCMALRYACTRHLSFLITDKGKVYPDRSGVVITEKGQAIMPDGTRATLKTVVINGRKAVAQNSVNVERWDHS